MANCKLLQISTNHYKPVAFFLLFQVLEICVLYFSLLTYKFNFFDMVENIKNVCVYFIVKVK